MLIQPLLQRAEGLCAAGEEDVAEPIEIGAKVAKSGGRIVGEAWVLGFCRYALERPDTPNEVFVGHGLLSEVVPDEAERATNAELETSIAASKLAARRRAAAVVLVVHGSKSKAGRAKHLCQLRRASLEHLSRIHRHRPSMARRPGGGQTQVAGMRSLRFPLLTFLLWGVALACWPSGGTGSASGGAGGASGGAESTGGAGSSGSGGVPDVTWKENGVLRTATYASLATRHTTAASDTFNFVATDFPASATLSFAVSSQALLDGTYACGSDGGSIVAVSYNNVATTDQSCSLTVSFTTDSAGKARATGTFEAVTVIPAGTKTLTEGLFDVAVMPI